MMAVAVITPPPALVSLALAKKHLRVDDDDGDDLITAYIAAACGHIDGPGAYLGQAIGTQVLEIKASSFPHGGCGLSLPYAPVIDVTSVKYRPVTGVEIALAPQAYALDDTVISPVNGSAWPDTDLSVGNVRVRWRAGYETLPPSIIAAVLLMTGDLFANRETVIVGGAASAIPMSTTVENLLRPYRALQV